MTTKEGLLLIFVQIVTLRQPVHQIVPTQTFTEDWNRLPRSPKSLPRLLSPIVVVTPHLVVF